MEHPKEKTKRDINKETVRTIRQVLTVKQMMDQEIEKDNLKREKASKKKKSTKK